MITVTIEIPDNKVTEVMKYLNENDVLIKQTTFKTLDELTEEDYDRNFKERTLKTREFTLKHL